MFDWLTLAGFSIATAAALSVDVCLYAIARFGAGNDASSALRFGFEVAVAHCVLLVLGASTAVALGRTLGSDVIVDGVSVLALCVVLAGAFARARAGITLEAPEAPSRSLSWFTAFALSIDGFLVGPSIDEFVAPRGDVARGTALAVMFATIGLIATLSAATSRRLRERLLSNRRAGRVDAGSLALANAAELCVFAMFVADGLARVFAHLGSSLEIDATTARLFGVAVGSVLFFMARRGREITT